VTEVWEFPASYGQERIWLANQMQPGSSVYHVTMTYEVPSTVDCETVVAALRQIVQRHESLRTALRVDGDGTLLQVVHADVPVTVDHDPAHDDLRGLSYADGEARFLARTRVATEEPFALGRPPLWRARLLRGERGWWLVMVGHHVIVDATSFGVIEAELTELWTAAEAGRPSSLHRLPIQYADWAVWHRQTLLSPARVERELAYWRERLAGAPPIHAVPLDRPRAATQDFAGDEIRFAIPTGIAERVERLARQLRVTEFAVLFGAYATLLARLGGEPDVVVGVLVAGRGPRTAALIGMFVNTVVLRVDTDASSSFAALVGQVAQATAAALEHAAVPVQRVVEELVPYRDPAVAPLYQIGFNHLPGTPLNAAHGTARDELAIELSGLEGRVEYRTGLFDPATARAFADRYLRVLDALTADPTQAPSRAVLLDQAERARLLEFGTGAPSTPDGPTIAALVLARAAATPDAVAVVGTDTTLRYGELAARAAELAGRLREAGAGPDRIVGVALPRSPELAVAFLGVLMTGGGYVPLDPALPAERLAYMLADSGAVAVVTAPMYHGSIPDEGLAVLDVVTESIPDSLSTVDLSTVDGVAYVIYTSGSTGRPKGAAVGHRSLANFVRWFVGRTGLGPADRVLASTSPSFDAFGVELFPALAAGGTVVVAPDIGGFDPDALLRQAAAQRVTLLPTVPTLLRALVDSPRLADCADVRQIVCGGEQLTGELVAAVQARLPVPVHNLYGPTETTIAVTAHTCAPGERLPGAVPIGRPIPGARVRLLDEAGEPVPAGAIGQVHVGGAPVGRGYPADPQLTAERFVPDPDGPPGARYYRTGDLARWSADGVLSFVGRIDGQLKVRGRRIEPGEVAAALCARPGVRDAAVVRDGDRLVAYVLAEPGVDTRALRTGLRTTLPGYLVPAAVVAIPAFPLTPNGKLDVSVLPPPDYDMPAGTVESAPEGAGERLIASVWAQVLGVERVGVDDDFFDLGGHSLLASRIAIRLSDVLDMEVPVHLFFSHLTVRKLAAALEELMHLDQAAG
jgi:amino acid adenylation domain-containing protein